ncbi:MAG: hypothetical protein HRT69_06895 [Flavobacteriaceae bacterium]|nr:hypothetical protein [Flavobacteriaceae bacterium]
MSELLKLVDSLEVRLLSVIERLEEKVQINKQLTKELALKEEKNKQQDAILVDWEEKYEALKLTSSMLGSEDYKRETKLKINALIREIDHCITQLSK